MSNYRFIQNIDPQEFSSRFSYTEDSETGDLVNSDKIDVDAYERIDLGYTFEDLRPYLERLPEREQDLIEMYYQLDKDQAEIANIFEISQGAVSHRLRKALKRLKFLVAMPEINERSMLTALTNFFYPKGNEYYCLGCKSNYPAKRNSACPYCSASKKNAIKNLDVQIMMLMWQTSCQSVVRDQLGLSQIKVRHKFLKNIEKLEKASESNPKWESYVKGFNLLRKNYNILREVELPKWKNRQKNFIKH